MVYLAIMKWTAANRIAKYQDFATEAAAQAHVQSRAENCPGAFVVAHPGGNFADWLVDPVAKTISVDPLPVAKPTAISYEAFQSRFTSAEFDAATDYVEEHDITNGKPKRRALKQAMARVYAKDRVDLQDPKTDAFLQALVNGGVLTAPRKVEILTP